MTRPPLIRCPACGAKGTTDLTRLPDGRFACPACWKKAAEAEFSADELATIGDYCRAVADHLTGFGSVGRWNIETIKAAEAAAADEAGMDDALARRFFAFSRADFEWWVGGSGESIQ
jgi:hypothetical protein